MLSLAKPTHSQLRDYLWQQQKEPFTYAEVGATKTRAPSGYQCGHLRVQLGNGRECYLQAKSAMKQWRMFPSKFVDLLWPCEIEEERVVATLFRAPGIWTVNPCRIIYTIDDVQANDSRAGSTAETIERFGFAYGTVGQHLASGEERFLIEYDHADGTVWYEILCFSKTNHWLAVAAYPYLRFMQRRFRRLSAAAMKTAVQQRETLQAAV